MSLAYQSSFPPPRTAVICSEHKESFVTSLNPLHLENPPLANEEVKPWSPAWLPVCFLAELLPVYIHGPARVSQSFQLLEMSKFILYGMWVSGFVSAHISPDVWVSHLSGMYLKFCPMPKSQSYKNISILNNSWIFLKFPLRHCLSLFLLFQCFFSSKPRRTLSQS